MTNGGARGPLKIGDRFLKFEIRSLIGKGGHAWVYHGYDPFLDRDVAIKIIPNVAEPGRDLAQRAQNEARVLSKIKDDNVVLVSDGGSTDDGGVFIVMELLKGLTVRDALAYFGPLNIVEVLTLGAKIAAGVHAAHLVGAIHRDLKPENAFIVEHNGSNGIKVLDFGIAKLSGSGAATTQRDLLHGTLKYMSPEYLIGTGATKRSDIYSLGVMLYELLTGIAPCVMGMEEPTRDAIIYAQLHIMPPPLDELLPGLPKFFARTIQRMIAKPADDRFASMAEVAELFQAHLARYLREGNGRTPAARELWHPPADAAASPALNALSVNHAGNATTDIYVLSDIVPPTARPVALGTMQGDRHGTIDDIDTTLVSKPKFSQTGASTSSKNVQVTEPLRVSAIHTTTAPLFVQSSVLSTASAPASWVATSASVAQSAPLAIDHAPRLAPVAGLVLEFEPPPVPTPVEEPMPEALANLAQGPNGTTQSRSASSTDHASLEHPEPQPFSQVDLLHEAAKKEQTSAVRLTAHRAHHPRRPRNRDLLYLGLCFGTVIGLLGAALASWQTGASAEAASAPAVDEPIVVVSAQTPKSAEPVPSAEIPLSIEPTAPPLTDLAQVAVVNSTPLTMPETPPPTEPQPNISTPAKLGASTAPPSKKPHPSSHSASPTSGLLDTSESSIAPLPAKPAAKPPASPPSSASAHQAPWMKQRGTIY